MLHRFHPRNLDPDARAFGLGYLILLPLYLAPLLVTRSCPAWTCPSTCRWWTC